MTQDAATQRSFEKLIGAEPVIGRVDRLAALLPETDGRTLFHAGPPFALFETLPPPVKNAAAAAAMHEGLAETREDALAAIASGSIRLAPAQDIGLVTPLAFVVGRACSASKSSMPTVPNIAASLRSTTDRCPMRCASGQGVSKASR